jgi:hypothetical protein
MDIMDTLLLRQARRNAAPVHSTPNVQDQKIDLAQGNVYSLEGDSGGRTILCLQGVLWITQPGDPADYRLAEAQSLEMTRRGKIVVQAMEDSVFAAGESV